MPDTKFLDFEDCLALSGGYLVTVNMQHLYESGRSEALAASIFADPNARLCLDGRGAQKLFERVAGKPLPLVAGNALLKAWLERAAGRRVLVIGSTRDVIEEISRRYPDIDFVHDDSFFPPFSGTGARDTAAALAERYGAEWDGIMLALGVPKQELLARALSPLMPAVPMFCLGGSFEMLAGIFKRSPLLVQRLGLEGVWRLILEPSSKRMARLVNSYLSFAELTLRPGRLARITGVSG